MKKRTNIQIEHETLEKVKKEKIGKETYDNTINRLIKDKKWQQTDKMEMYLGEFLDRLSILLHKAQKIGPESYPEFVKRIEYLLLKVPDENFSEIVKTFRELYYINGEMWKLESDIRLNQEKDLGLPEVGRRAILIREWNNKRIITQNKAIKLFGGFENPNPKYWASLQRKYKK